MNVWEKFFIFFLDDLFPLPTFTPWRKAATTIKNVFVGIVLDIVVGGTQKTEQSDLFREKSAGILSVNNKGMLEMLQSFERFFGACFLRLRQKKARRRWYLFGKSTRAYKKFVISWQNIFMQEMIHQELAEENACGKINFLVSWDVKTLE